MSRSSTLVYTDPLVLLLSYSIISRPVTHDDERPGRVFGGAVHPNGGEEERRHGNGVHHRDQDDHVFDLKRERERERGREREWVGNWSWIIIRCSVSPSTELLRRPP